MHLKSRCLLATAIAALATLPAAAQNTAVTFGTNWVAQAEHGGYYQAVADGTYAACGLDVKILPGGPQVNNRALMLAGQVDFNMGGSTLDTINAVVEGLPIVTVAASFPEGPASHPDPSGRGGLVRRSCQAGQGPDLGTAGSPHFWAWMISAYGFKPEQREVYTFNAAPLIANKTWGMQGYLTSEPFFVEKEAGFKPDAWLIADAGYNAYSTIIETMADTVANKPEVVQCFVDGSAIGWYNFLYGDNAKAVALIKADNPDMSDEAIAYSIAALKEHGIVDSGDAETMGIGAMTDAHMDEFYASMVKAGVLPEGVDIRKGYTLQFVNKKTGLDLKPAQ